MKKADVVVIGGSAAGIPAALSCRRNYPEKSVLLARREKQALIPCGIPYMFGTLKKPEEDLIPDSVLEQNGIELVIAEVTEIDRKQKTLSVTDGEPIGYDKLVLATGSLPATPPIPGIEKKNVFTIKKDIAYLADMLNVINNTRNLVIIGGGFIGVEFADECKKNRDISVAIVEMLPHCLQLTLDEEFCIEAEDILTKKGINLLANKRVESILGNEQVTGIRLADGQEIKADAVIIGIGAVPNVELAKKSGFRLATSTGAILVDRSMRTRTDKDVFACGDCAVKASFFSGEPSNIMLASIASAEARTAGANLFSVHQRYIGEIGVFSTVVGGRTFACAGLTEKKAKDEGYNVAIGKVSVPDRHPGSMPGMTLMKMKLVFSKDNGVILGGEISGGPSAGELINAVSACILHRMTATDISVFQMGTHPAATTSPIMYPLVNAAELAVMAIR